MEIQGLKKCPDCGANPGETHMPGCDVEQCSVCGYQKISCHCDGHDQFFARWTGLWPGYAEAAALGLFTKWTDHGWEKCDHSDPEARPDLNTFFARSFNRVLFVKPKTDRGTERCEEKRKNIPN